MENLNEELLAVWLKLSSVVNNERIVSTIPYNCLLYTSPSPRDA